MASGWRAVTVALGLIAGGGLRGAAQEPAGDLATAGDAATAGDPRRTAFAAAIAELKKLMADLTVLQAQYQQPGADKPALEQQFEQKRAVAETAGKRLEDAAIAVLAVAPDDAGAREIASGVMAGSLQADDPG